MLFLQNVQTAAMQVAVLYVLVAVGFVCDKTGLYTEKAARLTNDLLFYIVTPAIIIQSFTTKFVAVFFGRHGITHSCHRYRVAVFQKRRKAHGKCR